MNQLEELVRLNAELKKLLQEQQALLTMVPYGRRAGDRTYENHK